jgi:hypothetical protein
MDDRSRHLNELRERISTTRYRVDPVAVADAILTRWCAETAEPSGCRGARRGPRARAACAARSGSTRSVQSLAA